MTRGSWRAGMVALLVLVCALGARMLNADIVFVDEYWSIYKAGAPPYGSVAPQEIYRRIVEVDPGGMGALYYFSLGAWSSLVGGTPFAVRAYSLFYGLLSVAAMYRLGREFFGVPVGFASAVALGLSAFFIDYLHEARAYTQVAFYTVLAVWCYWRARKSRGWAWQIGTWASVTALAYSHYVALGLGAVLGVFHLLTYRSSVAWWRTLWALLLAAGAYAPWLTVAFGVAERGAQYSREATSMRWHEIAPQLVYAFANANVALWALVAWFGVRPRPLAMRLLWAWVLLGLALVIAVNALIPFMVHLRYLMFLLPALALWAGIGMVNLARRGVPLALLLLLWGATGALQSLNPSFVGGLFGQIARAPAEGITQAQAHLKAFARADDVLIWHFMPPQFEPFGLFVMDYLSEGIPHARREQVGLMNLSQVESDNDYLREVQTALAGAPSVWTVIVPQVPHDNNLGVVMYALNTGYSLCDAPLTHPEAELRFYARPPQSEAHAFSGDGVRLGMWLVRVGESAGVWRVSVLWDAQGLPIGTYSVGLHALGANGELLRQDDAGIPDVRPLPCQTLVLAREGLPADVRLALVVYDWRTGERLGEPVFILE